MAPAPRQAVGRRAIKIGFYTAALIVLGAAVWFALPRPQPPPPPIPVLPSFMSQFLAKEAMVYSPGTNAGEVVRNSTTPVRIEMRIAEFTREVGSIPVDPSNPDKVWLLNDTQLTWLLRTLSNYSGLDMLTPPVVETQSGRAAHSEQSVQRSILMFANSTTYTYTPTNWIHSVETVEVHPPRDATGTNFFNTNCATGNFIEVDPEMLTTGAWRLNVDFKMAEFLGYGPPELIARRHPALAKQLARKPDGPLPRFRRSHLTNQVMLVPGQTAVFGPITFDDLWHVRNQVPYLGQIPILGRFFRHERTETNHVAAYLLLTPRMLDDPSAP